MALVTSIRAARAIEPTTIAGTRDETAVTVAWVEPEPKLWVGSRAGEYAGMIEYAAGHFVVSDERGQDFGTFSDLAQAQAAVEKGCRKRSLPEGMLSNVAIVSAVVALSLAGMSLSMIAA